jgi:hypothetical protein
MCICKENVLRAHLVCCNFRILNLLSDFIFHMRKHNYLTPWSRGLLEKLTVCTVSQVILSFKEPEASQEPITSSYPEPYIARPHPQAPFPKIHFSSTLPSMSTSFEWSPVFRPSNKKSHTHFLYLPCALHAPPISFFLLCSA